MKKLKFLVLLACIATFIGFSNVNAANYTVDELGEQINEANPYANFAYIIGEYVFTGKTIVNTFDIMLASRSIDVVDVNGKVKTDDIYKEMVIYQINIIDYDVDNKPIWKMSTYMSADGAVAPSTFDIEYIDYEETSLFDRYEVKFVVDGNVVQSGEARFGTLITAPAEDPTKTGYVFAGWLEEGTTNFLDEGTDSVPVGGVTYVATWKKNVNTVSLLEDVAANVTTVDYTGIFDNGVLTLTMNNGAKKLTDISRSGLIAAINGLLASEGIDSITIEYDGVKYAISSSDTNTTTIAKLNSLMVAMSGKDVTKALINDLIDKDFTLTIKLADGYISEGSNQEETYNVEVEGTKLPTTSDVTNQEELKAALTNNIIETINVMNDFDVTESIIINRDVKINGNNKTISMATMPTYAPNGDNYIFKTYGDTAIEVEIKDLKLTNSLGAMIVGDNATVTIDNVDVSGNQWGGIEVVGTLNVTSIVQNDEAYAKPAIWIDTAAKSTAVVNSSSLIRHEYTESSKDQYHYYATNYVVSQSQLIAAITDPTILEIVIAKDFDVTESIIISRDVKINGNNKTISMATMPTYAPNGDNYIFKTYGDTAIEVEIKNLKLTNSLGAMIVGDNATVTIDNVDVSGNQWGGIEVVGTLNVTSIVQNDEAYAKPAIWIDTAAKSTAVVNSSSLIRHEYTESSKDQYHYYINSAVITP